MLYFFTVLVFVLPIKIVLKFDNKSVTVLLPIFKKRIKILSKSNSQIISDILRGKSKGKGVLKILRDHTDVDFIELSARVGTGNAASTAILSAKISSVVFPLLMRLGEFRVRIDPDFEKECFEFFGECIFSTNLANTLIAVLKIRRSKNGKNRKHLVINHGKSQ